MTATIENLLTAERAPIGTDVPRDITPALPKSDVSFKYISMVVGAVVLVITGAIGVFLLIKSFPTFKTYGFSFFTTAAFNPETNKIGILAVLVGTATVALIALAIAFPLAFATALFISEYAPIRVRSLLISMIDLMAAVPSIIWGLWGFSLIQPRAVYVSHWLNTYFGWFPLFHVKRVDPHGPDFSVLANRYTSSAFIAAIAVSMMVLPMACAIMRQVFSQTPPGEKEAALALGSTRWGMIRAVVLPFGRGGIIGGTMLALGRALGETIAVVIIIAPVYDVVKLRPLENGTATISALIAGSYGEATKQQLSALLTAGFVLFLITLVVNTIAANIVNRGRSAAGTDI